LPELTLTAGQGRLNRAEQAGQLGRSPGPAAARSRPGVQEEERHGESLIDYRRPNNPRAAAPSPPGGRPAARDRARGVATLGPSLPVGITSGTANISPIPIAAARSSWPELS